MPYQFVALDDIVAANQPEEPEAAAESSAAAAAAAPRAAAALGDSRVASAVVALGGLLVAAAVFGMVATLRGSGDDGEYAAPLLHPVPEMPAAREGEGLRHVVSSNYMLAHGPAPSRSASDASIAQQQQQQ
jgi:hypothetical protein